MPTPESAFRLAPSVVERVWSLLDNSARRMDELNPEGISERPRIPTQEELEMLLSTAFWASLMREEGRTVQFSLEFCSGDEHATWTFAKPIQFSARELVRIAPAFQTRFEHLGVWPKPSGNGDLAIWGSKRYGLSRLRIRVIYPGRLTVHLDGGEKVVLSESRLGVVASTPSGFWKRPNEAMPRGTNPHGSNRRELGSDREISHALLSIAEGMFNHGHGGTLLFSPSGSWIDSVKRPVHYQFESPFTEARDAMAEVIDASLQPRDNTKFSALLRDMVSPESMARRDRLRSACAAIGTFTSIDGAVVLEHDFSVPAIGVKIEPKTPLPVDVDETDVFENTCRTPREVSELGGTRHSSAVQFAYDRRDSLAIVASQDGIVSAVEWDSEAERVVVTRHLELLLP